MNKELFVKYLNYRRNPLEKQEGATALHKALCEAAPDFYLHLLADPFAEVSHKREMLVNLLTLTAAHNLSRQRIVEQLRTIPAVEALQVVDIIRQMRINNRRSREVGLALLIGHEQFSELAATRRQRVTLLLKHLLGERTWSSVRRFLATPSEVGNKFLWKEVLHYATDVAVARETLCFLAGAPFTPNDPNLVRSLAAREKLAQGQGMPRETLSGLRGTFHKETPASALRALAANGTLAPQRDGPLTALYKDALLSGANADANAEQTNQYREELPERLRQAVGSLPLIEGQIAIILDLSASAAGSGEREQHPAALGLALTGILQRQVTNVTLYQVGGNASLGTEDFPRPQGVTDLASALLMAARQRPQAILVITDGFENQCQGDAAEVMRGMHQLGLTIPVYQLVPLFATGEDLTRRKLGDGFLLLPIEHEKGVRELLARLFLEYVHDPVSPIETEQVRQLLFAQ